MPSLDAAAAIPVTGTPTTPNSSSTPCCFKQRATSLAPSISAMMYSYATSGFGPGANYPDWHNGLPPYREAFGQTYTARIIRQTCAGCNCLSKSASKVHPEYVLIC